MSELIRRDGVSCVLGNAVLKSKSLVISRAISDEEYQRRLEQIREMPREQRAAARLRLIDELGV